MDNTYFLVPSNTDSFKFISRINPIHRYDQFIFEFKIVALLDKLVCKNFVLIVCLQTIILTFFSLLMLFIIVLLNRKFLYFFLTRQAQGNQESLEPVPLDVFTSSEKISACRYGSVSFVVVRPIVGSINRVIIRTILAITREFLA